MEDKNTFSAVRHTAWFIEVNLQAYIKQISQTQKLIVLTKIGLRFCFVNKFRNFYFSFFTFLCSYTKNGISNIDTVKYLQEFLVKDYDFTSPINQHGTNAENITLKNSSPHATKELTYIWLSKF